MGWTKCNTNGTSKGNRGKSSYGFCLRNGQGDLVYAEVDSLWLATNMVVDAIAIWKALQFCKTDNMHNIVVETNSFSLVKMIRGEWKIPWEIIDIVEVIQSIKEHININI